MHEHDLDLIADHAAGTAGDPERAQRLVSSCATCATEFETQQQIRRLVSVTSVDALNDIERSRLRRTVWESTGFAPSVVPSATRWWERRSLQFASAAAIVFVGIGLVGVLGQLRGQDTATDSIAAEDESAITQAPVENVDREFALEAAPEAGADTSEMVGDDMADAPASPAVVDLGEIDAASLAKAVEDALLTLDTDDAAGTEDGGATAAGDQTDGSLLDGTEAQCDLPESVLKLAGTVDGRQVVVAVGVDDPRARAVAVYADTCEPFDLE